MSEQERYPVAAYRLRFREGHPPQQLLAMRTRDWAAMQAWLTRSAGRRTTARKTLWIEEERRPGTTVTPTKKRGWGLR